MTAGDLNLPFEPVPRAELPPESVMLSGGVVVLSLVVEDRPAIGFRFAKPDGTGFYPMVVLCPDEVAALRALPGLVEQAATHALTGGA